MNRRTIALLAVFSIATGAVTSCAARSKTVTTESRYYSTREPSATGDPVVVSERETKTTTETNPEEDPGLVSGAVDVIGEAVALPFRAVGGLVRAIF